MIVKQPFTIKGAMGKPILIDLTYKNSHPKAPLIIFVHGFKGFKDWGTHDLVADFFAENGFRYLKFNFSHNGTTLSQPLDFADLGAFSDNTFTKEFEDLEQVISFACKGEFFPASNRVSLIGHSRGGGTSIIQTAKDERINKLITWASIAEFNSLWAKEQEVEWRDKGVIYSYNVRTKQNTPLKIDLLHDLESHSKEYNILEAATRINQPWLIIHGTADENVLLEQAEKLKNLNPNAKFQVIEGANHVFGASHPYYDHILPQELQLVCEKSLEFLTQ